MNSTDNIAKNSGRSFFGRLRDSLQQLIYIIISPLVKGMVKIGITPNMVTTIGFLGNVAAAALFIKAIPAEAGGTPDYNMILWGGIVLTIFSLFDMLDGQVARTSGKCTRFGAMYDSVLDRYSEMVTLGALAFLFMGCGMSLSALITFVALIGSVMVSYTRARAEGLDIECKVGVMQRPERVVVTFLAAIIGGAMGNGYADFPGLYVISIAVTVIAVMANITAIARILYCRNKLGSL